MAAVYKPQADPRRINPKDIEFGYERKQFDPTTKTSEKLLSFGWANDITTTAATLHFKAYGAVKTTVLYFDHGPDQSAWNRDEWTVYAHSAPMSESETTPNFYSIPIEDLSPSTYYSFVIESVYFSREMTHSKPIEFRTKNPSIGLGETGLKLDWLKCTELPHYPMIRQIEYPKIVPVHRRYFGFHIQWTNGKHFSFETGIKYDGKLPFSYLLSDDEQTIYIQLFLKHQGIKGALQIFQCHRVEAVDIDTSFTVKKSVTIDVKTMTRNTGKQKRGCTKYESSQLAFCGTKNQYIMSLAHFKDKKKRDRLRALHIFDFERKSQIQQKEEVHVLYRQFQICRFDPSVLAESSSPALLLQHMRRTMPWFMTNLRSRFLFTTQRVTSGHCKLQIHWNYDYSSVRREEALCHYFEGMSEFVFLVLSFVSNPLNVIENCYVVDLPHRATDIWFEGKDRIGICDNGGQCHYYRIVEDPSCTAI